MSTKKLRVLLTASMSYCLHGPLVLLPDTVQKNDDGPPGPESPYIYGLYRHLTQDLGWDVRVVIPSSQKSWIGKAYQIKETIQGRYFYPADSDGNGETSPITRPLKSGETAEWILLDATPATCANIGLHNIYHNEIDLLISGPNLGRNTSAAFALSSGTIGAALSSSLSQIRSIAVSYGTVMHPTPKSFHEPAHRLTAAIINHLWDSWGKDDGGLRQGEVDLYNVNVPMIEGLLSEEGLKIVWTTIWRNSYGRLFKAHPKSSDSDTLTNKTAPAAGPDSSKADPSGGQQPSIPTTSSNIGGLIFKFAPDMRGLINPSLNSVPPGSDGWAMHQGHVSVTPLRASFAEPKSPSDDLGDRMWKIKL